MSIISVFKSHLPSVSFFFKNGKQAPFINGEYVTEIESEIAELRAEIGEYDSTKSNHPHIYIDPAKKEIDTEAPSAIDIIKQEAYAQARKDLLAEQARALDPTANISASDAGSIAASLNNTAKLGGTDGVVPVTPVATIAADVGSSLTAKLTALKATTTPVDTITPAVPVDPTTPVTPPTN